jgi:multidrug resistance efflux pump
VRATTTPQWGGSQGVIGGATRSERGEDTLVEVRPTVVITPAHARTAPEYAVPSEYAARAAADARTAPEYALPPEYAPRGAEDARTTSECAARPEYAPRAEADARTTSECVALPEYAPGVPEHASTHAPAHMPEAIAPGSIARGSIVPGPIAPALDAAHPMFRRAALDAYQRGESVTGPLRLDTGSLWGILVACASLVLGALAIAALGSAELSTTGRAVLRPPEGLRSVAALTGGLVRTVVVETGQSVQKDQLIASVDTTDLKAQQLEAERALDALRELHEKEERDGAPLYERAIALLEHRAQLSTRRVSAHSKELKRLMRRANGLASLGERGLVAQSDGDAVLASLAEGEQTQLSIKDDIAQTLAQITALRRDRMTRALTRARELSDAEARLASITLRVAQTEVRAPVAGVVETLMVSAGDRVDAGALVAHVGPSVVPTSVVAFVPERDRSFMRVGGSAQLELDGLSIGEFGGLPARIARVGREIAQKQEIGRVIGAVSEGEAALVRVELDLVDCEQFRRLRPYLRRGTLMTARIDLRARRIISLVFEPVRRWLES